MKFVWSDKNRSINTLLNVLYIGYTIFISFTFAISFALENPTGGSGDESVNSAILLTILGGMLCIFWIPFFLKQFRIIKYLGIFSLIGTIILTGYIIYIDNNFYSIPIFVISLLLSSIVIFVCGNWKEKNYHSFINNSR